MVWHSQNGNVAYRGRTSITPQINQSTLNLQPRRWRFKYLKTRKILAHNMNNGVFCRILQKT